MGRLRVADAYRKRDVEDRMVELLTFDLGCDQDMTDAATALCRRFPGRY